MKVARTVFPICRPLCNGISSCSIEIPNVQLEKHCTLREKVFLTLPRVVPDSGSPFLILGFSFPICKMRDLKLFMTSKTLSNSDLVCLPHICHYLLDGLDLSGLVPKHLAAKCVALEACCFWKGSCVWIANGFNQRGSKYCLMKIWLCQRKELLQKPPSQEMNGIVCLCQKWLQHARHSDWDFFEGQGALEEVAKCDLPQKKSPTLLSPQGRNFSSDANDLNVLGQLTFWELQFAPLKNGTEIRTSWDHRSSRSWNGFKSLPEFANAILKEYMVKWRVRLWSKISVLISAFPLLWANNLTPQSSSLLIYKMGIIKPTPQGFWEGQMRLHKSNRALSTYPTDTHFYVILTFDRLESTV